MKYDQCTSVGEAAPWCSTQTDEYGTHVGGEWFWCPPECLADGQQDPSPHVCLTDQETQRWVTLIIDPFEYGNIF